MQLARWSALLLASCLGAAPARGAPSAVAPALRPGPAAPAPVPAAGPGAGSLAISPVRRDPGGVIRASLVAALCGARPCLAGVKASGSPARDLARTRRLGARAVLVGSVWRERGGRVLALALFTEGTRPVRTWTLPLVRDGLPRPGALAEVARDLDEVLGGEKVVAAKERGAPSPPTSTATPTATPTPVLPPAAPDRGAPSPRPSPPAGWGRGGQEARGPTATAPSPSPPAPRWLTLEAGLAPSRRTLTFPGTGTAPVGYTVTLPVTPRLRLELFPLAAAGGRVAGLGLFGDGAWQGDVALPGAAGTHRATFLDLRAGLLWRARVGQRLVLVPWVGWGRESFRVGAVGGAGIPGLPDSRLEGPVGGLDLERRLGAGRVTLLAGARLAWWRDAPDLAGGATFFPGGSALGLAAEAGAEVALGGPLSARLVGAWAATRWSLPVDPSGAYQVRSAWAEAFGGRVALRLCW